MDPNCISNPSSPLFQANYAAQQSMMEVAGRSHDHNVTERQSTTADWWIAGLGLALFFVLCLALRRAEA